MKILKVGKFCSPSTVISHEVLNMKRILVTYGGGMGGTRSEYYTSKIKKVGETLKVVTVDNKKLSLNPRFIVEIEDTKVLKVVTDVTAHSNYHSPICKKSIVTEYIDMSGYNNYILDSTYTESANSFYKDVEIENI